MFESKMYKRIQTLEDKAHRAHVARFNISIEIADLKRRLNALEPPKPCPTCGHEEDKDE